MRQRMAADLAGALGLALTALLAVFCFDTAPSVLGKALLSGAANGVIGYAFVLTLGITLVCSVLTQWWAY